MPITGQTLYEQKRHQFHAEASHARFMNDYLLGMQKTITTLAIQLNLESDWPDIPTNATENIDLDIDYITMVSRGMDYELTLAGHKSGDLSLDAATKAFEKSIADAIMHRDADLAEAADDFETIGILNPD